MPSPTLVERVQALPVPYRPNIVLGGYAVKTGRVLPIPGVTLAARYRRGRHV